MHALCPVHQRGDAQGASVVPVNALAAAAAVADDDAADWSHVAHALRNDEAHSRSKNIKDLAPATPFVTAAADVAGACTWQQPVTDILNMNMFRWNT